METKSFVKFSVNSKSFNIFFTLNFNMDMLDIKCSVTYFDDTAFNNGITNKWTVSKYCSEEEVLKKINEYLSKLPGSIALGVSNTR